MAANRPYFRGIARRSGRSTPASESRVSPLPNKPERNQQWPVDGARHRQVILYLVILNCRLRHRPEHAINRFAEITKLLQRVLHVGNDLVRRQTIIPVGRSIIRVVRIVIVVTPSRIPIAEVPRIKSAANQNDGVAMIPPPVSIMMILMPPAGIGKTHGIRVVEINDGAAAARSRIR